MVNDRPNGPSPSPRQLRHHRREFYGFLHFTVNTFTDKEWGYGDEPPSIFDPTQFDADALVEAARIAGMAGLILTCKHHDEFCLWPSAHTEHSVKYSPWRGGKGDIVREVSDACRRQGLEFGVYLSPWDRNHAGYGSPAYLDYYRAQLRELLTDYGPLFEVWFDGANGGDGYYGGANEKRAIDNRTYYDWETTWQIVRELQPDAMMFSDAGPDIRWVGNEEGIAGDPCWATLNTEGLAPGHAEPALLNSGERTGSAWLPAECDVSIRPGWFYHAHEDDKVRSPQNLADLYFKSVGRGASLHLNLPPDRRGRIHENDVESLKAFRAHLDATFENDRTAHATRSQSDDLREVTLALPERRAFNVVRLRENLPMGQRIGSLAVDAWGQEGWHEIGRVTSIGACRLLRLPQITTERVRIRILEAAATPDLSEIALFFEPGRS